MAKKKASIVDYLIIESEDDFCTLLNLEAIEKETILKALRLTGWVQKEAAKLLGITVRKLHYKIHEIHNLNHPSWRRVNIKQKEVIVLLEDVDVDVAVVAGVAAVHSLGASLRKGKKLSVWRNTEKS